MMKKLMIGLALSLGTALAALPAPAAAQSSCNRSCLAGKLDQFMKAVVAKDPGSAGLFVGVRQTQNSILTPPGEGIWATNTGIGALDRRYYDPTTGQAAFFGIMNEGQGAAIVSVRLKIERQQVTEAEWHVARAGDAGITGEPGKVLFDLQKLTATPPPQRTVPAAQRSSREALVAAVNSYFDGITAGHGRWVQANPGCLRLENGLEVTGRPQQAPETDIGHNGRGDCRSGYKGLNIANVVARRYPLVDVEQQVVLGSAVFIRTPDSPKRRNHFMEVFTMDGGKISAVHASMFYADPNIPLPNWEPYEGNFPRAAALVPLR
jgi:hypothetical protein